MDENRQSGQSGHDLPGHARLSLNRCNLPAAVLGSLTFQRHPVPLRLDGVRELHAALFTSLDNVDSAADRALHFKAYMRACFLLDHPEEAGFEPARCNRQRHKADYLRILRGWSFDPDGQEAAVLKSWVETRFGLPPRNHRGPLGDMKNRHYQAYLSDRATGLYNANALESQLDLLYTYCQYEVQRQSPSQRHILLYRGVNRVDEHEVLARSGHSRYVLVLNNLNSFTCSRERADEFGDCILEARTPLAKILFMPGLLPDRLQGENEYLVIGGVYEVLASRN